MGGAAVVRDKVAVKVKAALATVTTTGHVFGNGTTNAGIAAIPESIEESAVNVLVERGTTTRTGGTGNQFYARTFECSTKFPAFDRGEAERFIDLLDDALLDEFSDGITLGGSVIEAAFTGSDKPFLEGDPAATSWWTWLFRIDTRERYPAEMTP